MKISCTICSREKNTGHSLLPAIRRYASERIHSVHEKSKADKVEFRILSGRFGLLAPDEKIPFYDHLLVSDEIKETKQIVKAQMIREDIDEVVFFMENLAEHPNWQAYYEVIRQACSELNIKFQEEIITDGDALN